MKESNHELLLRTADLVGEPVTTTGSLHLRLPEDLSLDNWRHLGQRIMAVSESSSWWIGDWLVFGQERYRERYKRAMEDTLLDHQTLRNYAWVARKFSPSRRRPELTFHHHMEVAALAVEEQDSWLEFAVRLKWTRNELRKQIRASMEVDSDRMNEIRLQLTLSQDRIGRWRKAAESSNMELIDWIADAVDRAL